MDLFLKFSLFGYSLGSSKNFKMNSHFTLSNPRKTFSYYTICELLDLLTDRRNTSGDNADLTLF